jgi:hypothetical protein
MNGHETVILLNLIFKIPLRESRAREKQEQSDTDASYLEFHDAPPLALYLTGPVLERPYADPPKKRSRTGER